MNILDLRPIGAAYMWGFIVRCQLVIVRAYLRNDKGNLGMCGTPPLYAYSLLA